MKKQMIILSMILIIGNFKIFSQSITNTSWTVYDNTNTVLFYFHFNNDTMSYSIDNSSYSNVSRYQVNSNNFTMVDLSGSSCSNDTGHYTFLIQNDSLKFTLVNDLCNSRSSMLTNNFWVRLSTGIKEINSITSCVIYPNPCSELLIIPITGEKIITVTSLLGQIVKTIKTEEEKISLKDIIKGNYIINVFDKNYKLLTSRQIIHE